MQGRLSVIFSSRWNVNTSVSSSVVTFNRMKHIWTAATRELLLDSRPKRLSPIDPTCEKTRLEVVYVVD